MIANGNTYCRVITPILPPEYQEVEYIESDGNQYIETNVIADQDTSINVRFKLKHTGSLGANVGSIIYSGAQHYNNRTKECYTGNQTISLSNGFTYKYPNITTNKTDIFEVENNKNVYVLKNVTSSTSDSVTHDYVTFTTPYSIWLFALHRQNGMMTNFLGKGAKIYKCSILQDTTLVRNFIPCYRISDNEIGMYDTVNKVFYTNQGTGTFLKGNNVVHTIRYKIPTEERPYISGHVIDGSSTFSFYVNKTQQIQVQVDNNGNWKWYADRAITSFENAFYNNNVIDTILIYGFKDFTTTKWMFNSHQNYDSDVLEYVEFRNCDFSKTIDETRMFRGQKGLKSIIGLDSTKHSSNETFNTTFQNCNELEFEQDFNWQNLICSSCTNFTGTFMGCKKIVNVDASKAIAPTTIYYMFDSCSLLESINMPKILSDTNVNGWAAGSSKLKNVTAEYIAVNISLTNSAVYTKQSIINLINAAAANVTYTLHSTVYNKCKSGGEWYSDIQAAIDAKAQQGYTVTLISA